MTGANWVSVTPASGARKGPRPEWWARGDLNPGPPPCEGGVLTRLDDGPTAHGVSSPLGFIVFSPFSCFASARSSSAVISLSTRCASSSRGRLPTPKEMCVGVGHAQGPPPSAHVAALLAAARRAAERGIPVSIDELEKSLEEVEELGEEI